MTKEEEEGSSIFTSSFSLDTTPVVNADKLWEKIYDSLRLILSREHTDPAKREAKAYADRIQFACVYCGDSHNDSKKKRGNLFVASSQYHCFNGDCHAHMSVHKFLTDKGELDKFTADEQIYLKNAAYSSFSNIKGLKSFQGMETFFSEEILDLSVDREFLMKKMKLQEIRGSRIQRYLEQRHQLEWKKYGWDPSKGLLYVFNMNSTHDRIIGLQIKTFSKRNPYLTWKATRLHHELEIFKDENAEKLMKLDTLSNIFNIFQINLSKPMTVFEGPLDSFLFPNSVALCSAKNSLPFDVEGVRYFYDNDTTGREYSIIRINEGKSVFLWKKYLDENELSHLSSKIKDLNDLLIYIRRAGRKFGKFVDYFSDSKYDAVWI